MVQIYVYLVYCSIYFYKSKVFATHPSPLGPLGSDPNLIFFHYAEEVGSIPSSVTSISQSGEWGLSVHHTAEWGLSDAHSNFDFPPLMAKQIGLSLNFQSNQLKSRRKYRFRNLIHNVWSEFQALQYLWIRNKNTIKMLTMIDFLDSPYSYLFLS